MPPGVSAREGVPMSDRASTSDLVREFHETFGLPVRDYPVYDDIDPAEDRLRYDLLMEEAEEYDAAFAEGDFVGMVDALADLVYIAYGTAHVFGVDLDEVIREVHRSNMSKLGEDGRPIYREDGKVLKGPGYFPPNIEGLLWWARTAAVRGALAR